MEMLSSLRGDKHEFCLVVIKFKHVHSCRHTSTHLDMNGYGVEDDIQCLNP